MEPARELRFIHYATHQVSFHQRGRKEIFAPGLPRCRVVHVFAKVTAAAFDDQRCQFAITQRARVIERERQSKRCVRMHAGANRIILLGKKRQIFFYERIGERLQIS